MQYRVLLLVTLLLSSLKIVYADTIGKYAQIAKSIPEMSLKADPQSHAWARSARSILAITDETIAETINVMNQLATKHGTPLLCITQEKPLNAQVVHTVLAQLIQKLTPAQAAQSISESLLQQLQISYPCKTQSFTYAGKNTLLQR